MVKQQIRKIENRPEWFCLKNYEKDSNLTTNEWFYQLLIRYVCIHTYYSKEKSVCTKEQVDKYLKEIYKKGILTPPCKNVLESKLFSKDIWDLLETEHNKLSVRPLETGMAFAIGAILQNRYTIDMTSGKPKTKDAISLNTIYLYKQRNKWQIVFNQETWEKPITIANEEILNLINNITDLKPTNSERNKIVEYITLNYLYNSNNGVVQKENKNPSETSQAKDNLLLKHFIYPYDKFAQEYVLANNEEFNIFYSSTYSRGHLVINLNVPTDQLYRDFKKMLPKYKKLLGAKDIPLTQNQFKLWSRNKILPYTDLQMWAELNNCHIANHVIADAILPTRSGDTTEFVRKNVKPAACKALSLATLHALKEKLRL